MALHNILITFAGSTPFYEKFHGRSHADAVKAAKGKYQGAQHVEWKGGARSDAEEAASAAFFAECERKTQETYARQAEHTAKTWEHQRQLDARDASAPSYATAPRSSSSGGSGCGTLLVLAPVAAVGVLGLASVVGVAERGITGAVTAPLEVIGAFVDGFNEGRNGAAERSAGQVGIDIMPTVENPTYGYDGSTQHPCEIWANANPALAAELVPGDLCWGF